MENGVAAVVVEAGKSDESVSSGFLDLALRWPIALRAPGCELSIRALKSVLYLKLTNETDLVLY